MILGVDRERVGRRHQARLPSGWRASIIRTSIRATGLAAVQFRQIAEAYETLSDPDRRRRYDVLGDRPAAGSGPGIRVRRVRFLGERERGRRLRPSAICSPTSCSSARRARKTLRRGAPTCTRRSRSGFEEAMRGGRQQVTVTRQEHCRACGGAGRLHADETIDCAACARQRRREVGARTHGVLEAVCDCGGTGRQRRRSVRTCAGQTVEMRTEALLVEVPPGSRRRADSGGGQGARRPARRRIRRSLHHRAGPAAPAVSPRGRRPARGRAGRDSRGGARRQDRRAVARRAGPAARAARHAVGSAVPASRTRCAVVRGTAAAAISWSRCGWCCPSCSTNGRRSCCGNSGGSTRKTCGKPWARSEPRRIVANPGEDSLPSLR